MSKNRTLPTNTALRTERLNIYAEMRDSIDKAQRAMIREMKALSDIFSPSRNFTLSTPIPAEADDIDETLAPLRAVISALHARLTYLCESLRAHHEDHPVKGEPET